jgi:hypothetical protein
VAERTAPMILQLQKNLRVSTFRDGAFFCNAIQF